MFGIQVAGTREENAATGPNFAMVGCNQALYEPGGANVAAMADPEGLRHGGVQKLGIERAP
jgi:hypothetical protein